MREYQDECDGREISGISLPLSIYIEAFEETNIADSSLRFATKIATDELFLERVDIYDMKVSRYDIGVTIYNHAFEEPHVFYIARSELEHVAAGPLAEAEEREAESPAP